MDIDWDDELEPQQELTLEQKAAEEALAQQRGQKFEEFVKAAIDALKPDRDSLKDFHSRYAADKDRRLHAFVYSRTRPPLLTMEVLARVPPSQEDLIGSHLFRSHDFFLEKMKRYCSHDSFETLTKSRPWDVAVHMTMKVEFFDKPDEVNASTTSKAKQMLLRREARILEAIWLENKRKAYNVDEMIGFPLFFEYQEVLIPKYCVPCSTLDEINAFGQLSRMEPTKENKLSLLKYLTTEKTGPPLDYLIKLYEAGTEKDKRFDFGTAFKMFDQLVCRLLHLHRLGFLHNNVGTRTVTLGRHTTFNVVHLTNYAAATRAMTRSASGKRLDEVALFGSVRFASRCQLQHSHRHPVQDLESAFYVLLAMLATSLPWDDAFGAKLTSNHEDDDSYSGSNPCFRKDELSTQAAVLKIKRRLWEHGDVEQSKRAKSLLEKICDNIMNRRRGSNEEPNWDLSKMQHYRSCIENMHRSLLDLMANCEASDPLGLTFSLKLKNMTSKECVAYYDLRRAALSIFKFDRMKGIFSEAVDKRKDDAKTNEIVTLAFDTSTWCFLKISIANSKHSGKHRLHT